MSQLQKRLKLKVLASFVLFLVHGFIVFIDKLNISGFKSMFSLPFWKTFIPDLFEHSLRVSYVFFTQGKQFLETQNGHFVTYGIGTLVIYLFIFTITWTALDIATNDDHPLWIHIASLVVAFVVLIALAIVYGRIENLPVATATMIESGKGVFQISL